MPLILETGAGLANADSLVSLAEVRAFAVSRGKVVSSNDAVLEPQVRVAHDYLLAHERRLAGWRTKSAQSLPYPRAGIFPPAGYSSIFSMPWNIRSYGYVIPENVVPQAVKNAVCQLVIEGLDRDLLPSQDARVVITETVGPITTVYANTGTVTANPVLPRVEAFLAPLLSSQSLGLQSERV